MDLTRFTSKNGLRITAFAWKKYWSTHPASKTKQQETNLKKGSYQTLSFNNSLELEENERMIRFTSLEVYNSVLKRDKEIKKVILFFAD